MSTSKEREELLSQAQGVGLAVGVDFAKNIKSDDLKVLIENKKAELENQLKGNTDETNTDEQENEDSVVEKQTEETAQQDSSILDGEEQSDETNTEGEETYEDEMMILRVSKCGNYKTKIKGIKEAARRSGVTEEEVKEAIEANKSTSNGFSFKKV